MCVNIEYTQTISNDTEQQRSLGGHQFVMNTASHINTLPRNCAMVCQSSSVLGMDKWLHPGLILDLRPANERRRYFVTTSLIGWAQT